MNMFCGMPQQFNNFSSTPRRIHLSPKQNCAEYTTANVMLIYHTSSGFNYYFSDCVTIQQNPQYFQREHGSKHKNDKWIVKPEYITDLFHPRLSCMF